MTGIDDQLVEQMLRGDEDAFRAVYRSVQPGLLRYLTVLVGTDAEDVAAEAWAHAVRDLGRFKGDADGFRGWITTIGRHRALDQLRRNGRRPVVHWPVEELEERVSPHDTEQAALEGISTREALELIAALPADQAESVLLRAVVGLDAKGAGAVLGKKPGAVRTAAYRGLKTLQRRLDEDAAPSPLLPGPATLNGAT